MRPLIIVLALSAASCVMPSVPDLPADSVMTVEAAKSLARPILLSRKDVLTVGTLAQIEDHNNRIWCQFPDLRPGNFDDSVCPAR